METVYVSGPITGKANYRESFTRAADWLENEGYVVLNPAALEEIPGWTWQQYMKRAISLMMQADTLVLIPGWPSSRGVSVEATLALALGMKIFSWNGVDNLTRIGKDETCPKGRSVLEEAQEIVGGSRHEAYGNVRDDFERTTALFAGVSGKVLTAEEGVLFMMCVKLSRERNKHSRDNMVDLCGYAKLYHDLKENLV